MSQGCALSINYGSKVQGQGHNAQVTEMVPDPHLLFFILIVMYLFPMYLHIHFPHESKMWLIHFGVKGQGHLVWILKIVSSILVYMLFLIVMEFHTKTPHESTMCPIDFEV